MLAKIKALVVRGVAVVASWFSKNKSLFTGSKIREFLAIAGLLLGPMMSIAARIKKWLDHRKWQREDEFNFNNPIARMNQYDELGLSYTVNDLGRPELIPDHKRKFKKMIKEGLERDEIFRSTLVDRSSRIKGWADFCLNRKMYEEIMEEDLREKLAEISPRERLRRKEMYPYRDEEVDEILDKTAYQRMLDEPPWKRFSDEMPPIIRELMDAHGLH